MTYSNVILTRRLLYFLSVSSTDNKGFVLKTSGLISEMVFILRRPQSSVSLYILVLAHQIIIKIVFFYAVKDFLFSVTLQTMSDS